MLEALYDFDEDRRRSEQRLTKGTRQDFGVPSRLSERVTEFIESDRVDVITETSARSMHDLFNAPSSPPAHGEALPPLWHWMAFPPRSKQADLGNDGHPKVHPHLGISGLPQRMFAGGRIYFHRDILVGESLTRLSRVKEIRNRVGHSGNFTIVTLLHEIRANEILAIEEEQDLIYRERTPLDLTVHPQDDPEGDLNWKWRLELSTLTTALFRYSALTYNAHRIHYDLEYAKLEEGYPGLLVAGPYQATGIAEIVRRFVPSRTIESFSFKAIRPAFANAKLRGFVRPADVSHLIGSCFDTDNCETVRAEIVLRAW